MVKIRKMKIEDVELVYALGIGEKRFRVGAESAGFWTKEQLRNWVKSKDDVLLVAEENRQIVGYVLSQYHAPTRKATFENLYVFPKYRNLGIAKMLTLELIHQLKEKKAYICGLIETDNESIAQLLGANGFKKGKQMIWMDQSA